MPLLSRNDTKLLRRVANKEHATDQDHDLTTGLPSPATTSSARSSYARSKTTPRSIELLEDYTRSPISSDEDVQMPPARVPDFVVLSAGTKTKSKGMTAKRKANDSESDDELFGSLGQVSQSNAPKFKRMTYGSSQNKSSQPKTTTAGFKKPKTTVPAPAPPRKQAVFKPAIDADVFQFQAGSDGSNAIDLSDAAPFLSSPPPSSVEVLDISDLAQPTQPRIQCPVCNADVDLLLKQEYDDEYQTRQHEGFSIRRQNAFCRYHTQHDARLQWKASGYPAIDWSKLGQRIQKRHARLKRIISGGIRSSYRDSLTKQIAQRSHNTAEERARVREVRTSAGYYGPRGQKIIMEEITTNLSSALREASRSDPLIMAAGTDAGLAGFIQQVLVPELVTELIMEDMRLSREKAMVLLAESEEIGEILNEEEHDVIVPAA